MPAKQSGKLSSRVAVGVGLAVLVALTIAVLVHVLSAPSGTAPEPTYAIDPKSLMLTTADIGASFSLVVQGSLGPSQHTAPGYPVPYQRYFLGGWGNYCMSDIALDPPGRTELDHYSQQLGIPPSDPPTVFGPFVAEHQGLFDVSDDELSYQLASAAHPDYLISHPGPDANGNYLANYDHWQTYPIQLGDEADAWGGIQDTPAKRDDYEEQVFRVRWRHGPIVSTIFVRGAHDLTLDTALHLAHIVDARIASAIQHATKGAFHVSTVQHMATSVSDGRAVHKVDRRPGQRLDWA
jgi:hypothetical protein